MAERLNAAVLKTVIPSDGNRGFESPSLLQFFNNFLFPQKMSLRIKNRYYPDISQEMIRAIYNDFLLNSPMLTQKYLGNMNENTTVIYKFLIRARVFTVKEL